MLDSRRVFGSDPQHLSELGSDRKTNLKSDVGAISKPVNRRMLYTVCVLVDWPLATVHYTLYTVCVG